MKTNSKFDSYYEEIEFALVSGSTNVPLSTIVNTVVGGNFLNKFGFAAAANLQRFPTRLIVRTTGTMSISLLPNTSTTNPGVPVNNPITLTSTDSPYTIDGVEYGDVLFSNASGSTIAVACFISDSQY